MPSTAAPIPGVSGAMSGAVVPMQCRKRCTPKAFSAPKRLADHQRMRFSTPAMPSAAPPQLIHIMSLTRPSSSSRRSTST